MRSFLYILLYSLMICPFQSLHAVPVYVTNEPSSGHLIKSMEQNFNDLESRNISKEKNEAFRFYQDELRDDTELNSFLKNFIGDERVRPNGVGKRSPRKNREREYRKRFSKIDVIVEGLEREYKKRGKRSHSIENYIREIKAQQRIIHSKYNRLRMNQRDNSKGAKEQMSSLRKFKNLKTFIVLHMRN